VPGCAPLSSSGADGVAAARYDGASPVASPARPRSGARRVARAPGESVGACHDAAEHNTGAAKTPARNTA
jgi:hypothetical protein